LKTPYIRITTYLPSSQELKVNEKDFIDFAEFMKLRSLGGFMSGLLIIPQGKPYE
jgi:hypothetical protein